MHANNRKRAAALSSTLIAASIALMPLGLQSASAATPSETQVSEVTAVPGQGSYRQGYRAGFRDGYADARDDCSRDYGVGNGFRDRQYARGYADGYSAGYARAERRYC